jgi:hypothetical protein
MGGIAAQQALKAGAGGQTLTRIGSRVVIGGRAKDLLARWSGAWAGSFPLQAAGMVAAGCWQLATGDWHGWSRVFTPTAPGLYHTRKVNL